MIRDPIIQEGLQMYYKKWILIGCIALAILIVTNLFFLGKISRVKNETNETLGVNSKTKTQHSEEEYVWISCIANQSMFVNHDQKALKQFGKDLGVKVTVEGPNDYDISGQAEAIRNVIKRRPAGIMVLGMERGLIQALNEAVDAGIPTITVDADLVESKRMAFVGSNWYNLGIKQAEAMVKLIGGKGKVAAMGIGGADNMQQGFDGFKSVINNYPDIIYLGDFDDMASLEESQRITEEILTKYPDISGIAGFDVNSGPGIGAAIKQADKVGKVKATCVDIEPIHLKLCKEGVIQKLIGQKRELFTYYGARLLYDFNHATLSLSADDKRNKIMPIPYIVDTGLIEVDQTNVDSFLNNN
jgi:ribose transport system substrate-binding protein